MCWELNRVRITHHVTWKCDYPSASNDHDLGDLFIMFTSWPVIRKAFTINMSDVIFMVRRTQEGNTLKNLSGWAGSHGAKLPLGSRSLEIQTNHLKEKMPRWTCM